MGKAEASTMSRVKVSPARNLGHYQEMVFFQKLCIYVQMNSCRTALGSFRCSSAIQEPSRHRQPTKQLDELANQAVLSSAKEPLQVVISSLLAPCSPQYHGQVCGSANRCERSDSCCECTRSSGRMCTMQSSWVPRFGALAALISCSGSNLGSRCPRTNSLVIAYPLGLDRPSPAAVNLCSRLCPDCSEAD